jgi:hypothetical protein
MSKSSKNINGKLTRTGVIVLEVFSLDLRDEDAKKQFSNNREETFRMLIKKEGIEVNRFTLLNRNDMNLLERCFTSNSPELRASGNFHIVYPSGENSGWICCCAD